MPLTYRYDEANQRLLKSRDGRPEAAFIDGSYLDADGFIDPVSVGGGPVGILNHGVFQLIETDPRGSLLRDAAGTVCEISPFGARSAHPDISAAFDYVEKGYDADLGVVRMGVRDYDPSIAQFWTPDPLLLENPEECAASPIDCNLRAYARNNPLSFVDPKGTTPTTGLRRMGVPE